MPTEEQIAYPMNSAPGSGDPGIPGVYVVTRNEVVTLVTSSMDSAKAYFGQVMSEAVGLGPWLSVGDPNLDGFTWVGPGGALVMCKKFPITP